MKTLAFPLRHSIESALCTALLVVSAWLCIPLPFGVSLTAQTFAVCLCGALLPTRFALLSIALYLCLGALGLPVFAGGMGGVGVLLSPAGGFLFGFLPLCALCSVKKNPFWCALCGLLSCHALGIAWFCFFANTSLLVALCTASLPFFAKDLLSLWLARRVAKRLRRAHLGIPAQKG